MVPSRSGSESASFTRRCCSSSGSPAKRLLATVTWKWSPPPVRSSTLSSAASGKAERSRVSSCSAATRPWYAGMRTLWRDGARVVSARNRPPSDRACAAAHLRAAVSRADRRVHRERVGVRARVRGRERRARARDAGARRRGARAVRRRANEHRRRGRRPLSCGEADARPVVHDGGGGAGGRRRRRAGVGFGRAGGGGVPRARGGGGGRRGRRGRGRGAALVPARGAGRARAGGEAGAAGAPVGAAASGDGGGAPGRGAPRAHRHPRAWRARQEERIPAPGDLTGDTPRHEIVTRSHAARRAAFAQLRAPKPSRLSGVFVWGSVTGRV